MEAGPCLEREPISDPLRLVPGDATGVLLQAIRRRLGHHQRVAEKLGDEPNGTTADQAGSFR